MKDDSSFFGKNFHLELLLIVLCVLFLALLIQYTSFAYKRYQIETKKQMFVEENDRLKAMNLQLAQQYEYNKTDYFFRKEAKRKLNKKESGEKVVIVTEKKTFHPGEGGYEIQEDLPALWWKFFFGEEKSKFERIGR